MTSVESLKVVIPEGNGDLRTLPFGSQLIETYNNYIAKVPLINGGKVRVIFGTNQPGSLPKGSEVKKFPLSKTYLVPIR